ncbi:MAG: hypothetical protein HY329_17275 [Chloroflexi bacterium]|nr:hypothetical protein [Chloroflexota bacterium]
MMNSSAESLYEAFAAAEARGSYQEAFDLLYHLEQVHPNYREGLSGRLQQYQQLGYQPSVSATPPTPRATAPFVPPPPVADRGVPPSELTDVAAPAAVTASSHQPVTQPALSVVTGAAPVRPKSRKPKIFAGIAVFLLLVFGGLFGWSSAGQGAYDRARAAHNAGNAPEANSGYNAVVASYPDFLGSFVKNAQAGALETGRYLEAEKAATDGKWQDAINLHSAFLKDYPNSALKAKATQGLANARAKHAEALVAQAKDIADPNQRAAELRKIREEYKDTPAAGAAEPLIAEAYLAAGNDALKANQPRRAVDPLREVVRNFASQPAAGQAKAPLADALVRAADEFPVAEVTDRLDEALGLQSSPELLERAGQAAVKNGERAQAEKNFDAAIRLYSWYLEKQPQGKQIAEARRGLIAAEVGQAAGAGGGTLPPIQAGRRMGGQTATVEVQNDSSEPLVSLFHGPVSERQELAPGEKKTVTLPPGKYSRVVKVNKPNTSIRPFSGESQLEAGYQYSIRYFISTSRS